MKNILYIFCAAILLTACQKEHIEQIAADGELTFTASMDGMPTTQSRASWLDTDLKAQGFYLAGYHTDGKMEAAPTQAYPNVFDHDANDRQVAVPLVQYSGGKFTLKTIKWKLDDASYLNFYGWSQSKPIPTSGVTASTTGVIDYTKSTSDKGYPWIVIRNADAPADQSDVVAARSINHRNDAVLSAVDLNFHHLLSKLSFKAKSSTGGRATIRQMFVIYAAGKVSKKAIYTLHDQVETIGAYGGYTEFQSAKSLLSATQIIEGGAEEDMGSLLLIPQDIETGDISLEVIYNIWPSPSATGQDQTKVIPLSALKLEQGKNYLYTLDVKATEITIGAYPTIEPWNLATTSMPIIAGPKGETLLLLDGYDKPYQHIDKKWYWLDRSGYNRHVELEGYYNGMHDEALHTYIFKQGSRGRITSSLGSPTKMTVDLIYRRNKGGDSFIFKFGNSATGGAPRPFWMQLGWDSTPLVEVDAGHYQGGHRLTYTVADVSEFNTRTYWTTIVKPGERYVNLFRNAKMVAQKTDIPAYSFGVLDYCLIAETVSSPNVLELSYFKVTSNERITTAILADYATNQKRFLIPLEANSPAESDYVIINGLAWAKGNLVSTSNNKCKIGTPTDYGVYFQFGSLVGWKGGATGSGTGQGEPALDKQVWPIEMGGAKPSFAYQATQGDNIGELKHYFFNYSVAPWATDNTSSDIGTFNVPITGDSGIGDLRNGRYAALGVGDPCTYYLGYPWRLPNQVEMGALKNSGYSAWTTNGVVDGRWFGPNAGNTATSIFLGAAGSRYSGAGYAYEINTEARYQTSSIASSTNYYYIFINKSNVFSPDKSNRNAGVTARCVRNL